MADAFENHQPGLEAPAAHVALVTPDDSNNLPNAARGLLIGGSGALKVTTVGGETITLPATVIPAGSILPLRVARVWSTGTTATDIHALY